MLEKLPEFRFPPVKPPIRFWIGVLVFLTTFTTYTLRVNLSISIIKMASKSSKVPECAAPNTTVAPSEESKAADSEVSGKNRLTKV